MKIKSMTVAEVIAALQKLPQDAICEADGCDCIKDVTDVFLDDDGKVILAREDGAAAIYTENGKAIRALRDAEKDL